MLKKKEVLALWQNLHGVGNLTGAKFTYAIAKNINILRPEVEAIEKAIEMSDDFKEYEGKRMKLVMEYADKDQNDKPKLILADDGKTQEYSIKENKDVFNKKFDILKKDNKIVLEAREKQIKEYNALLKTESDFKPHKMKTEFLPETISSTQLNGIFDVIEEEE